MRAYRMMVPCEQHADGVVVSMDFYPPDSEGMAKVHGAMVFEKQRDGRWWVRVNWLLPYTWDNVETTP